MQWFQVWIRPRSFRLDGIVYVPHDWRKYAEGQFSCLDVAKEWAIDAWYYYHDFNGTRGVPKETDMEFKLAQCSPDLTVLYNEDSIFEMG